MFKSKCGSICQDNEQILEIGNETIVNEQWTTHENSIHEITGLILVKLTH